MTKEEIEALKEGDHIVVAGKEFELIGPVTKMKYETNQFAKSYWYKLEVLCGSGKETEIGVGESGEGIERA